METILGFLDFWLRSDIQSTISKPFNQLFPTEDIFVFLDKIVSANCRNTCNGVNYVHREKHAIYHYRQAS